MTPADRAKRPLRVEDFLPAATGLLESARARVEAFLTPTLRLGVTGLSGAGKTVFITALVRSLTANGRLPFFSPSAEGRILRAYLEPQPDDDVPRFAYEEHAAAIEADPPVWPEGTRRISQLRVTIEYRPGGASFSLGPARLHLDIVDYPGEWLIDLAMLGEDFKDWSREALAFATHPRRAEAARDFLSFLAGASAAERAEEQAMQGGRLYAAFLRAVRGSDLVSLAGPGRLLLPGDLEGSPLLAFFPWRGEAGDEPLPRLLARRYQSYKTRVVRPFFRRHFSRIDRQIVLVDALGAIAGGPEAIAGLDRSLTGVLAAFKPGDGAWLTKLIGRRIDRVLFAAAKADHVHHRNHDRLESFLRLMTDRAAERVSGAGAVAGAVALAAIRATREADAASGGERFTCVVGVPMPGEEIGGRVFDGRTEAAIFPGDLPKNPNDILDGAQGADLARTLRFPRFRPPKRPRDGEGTETAWPHIRLDRALEFLLADKLR